MPKRYISKYNDPVKGRANRPAKRVNGKWESEGQKKAYYESIRGHTNKKRTKNSAKSNVRKRGVQVPYRTHAEDKRKLMARERRRMIREAGSEKAARAKNDWNGNIASSRYAGDELVKHLIPMTPEIDAFLKIEIPRGMKSELIRALIRAFMSRARDDDAITVEQLTFDVVNEIRTVQFTQPNTRKMQERNREVEENYARKFEKHRQKQLEKRTSTV